MVNNQASTGNTSKRQPAKCYAPASESVQLDRGHCLTQRVRSLESGTSHVPESRKTVLRDFLHRASKLRCDRVTSVEKLGKHRRAFTQNWGIEMPSKSPCVILGQSSCHWFMTVLGHEPVLRKRLDTNSGLTVEDRTA